MTAFATRDKCLSRTFWLNNSFHRWFGSKILVVVRFYRRLFRLIAYFSLESHITSKSLAALLNLSKPKTKSTVKLSYFCFAVQVDIYETTLSMPDVSAERRPQRPESESFELNVCSLWSSTSSDQCVQFVQCGSHHHSEHIDKLTKCLHCSSGVTRCRKDCLTTRMVE